MKISISCPSCGAGGAVDKAYVGWEVRCKQCKYRFVIRRPDDASPDVYELAEPISEPSPDAAGEFGSTFVPARCSEPTTAPHRPRRGSTGSNSRAARRRAEDEESAWRPWLVRIGLGTVAALVVIALFAPRGMLLVGAALALIGSLMVLAGYGVGAVGAFREDFLYGFLYVVFPFYAAYYILTRWDDLWAWFACSTVGALLVGLGTWLLEESISS